MAKPKEKLAGRSAVIYARYSSHAQNDASIEQQVEACTKFAVGKGLTVLETYSDRAISGKSDKRPDFQRMMKDAHKGKFQCVLAWKWNLLVQIDRERRKIPQFTRDQVVAWLEGLAEGDVEDPAYQRKLIKQFLRAAYLYDDHLHLVFDYSEDDEGIDISLPLDDADFANAESVLISSDIVHSKGL